MPKDKIGDVKVMNNEYDNEKFFEEYAKMSRSKEGVSVIESLNIPYTFNKAYAGKQLKKYKHHAAKVIRHGICSIFENH